MLTKGAIGNLVNRYKAVLTKCNLINTFGSLAVASMLVLGGAGVAEAKYYILENVTPNEAITSIPEGKSRVLGGWRNAASVNAPVTSKFTIAGGTYELIVGGNYTGDANGDLEVTSTDVTITGGSVLQVVGGSGGSDNTNLTITGQGTSKLTITGGTFGSAIVSGNCPELLVIGGDLLKAGPWGPTVSSSASLSETETTISGDAVFNAAIVGGSVANKFYAALYYNTYEGLNVSVTKAKTTITGGTFNHPIVAGGFAYGDNATSTVTTAELNISNPSGTLIINENIYSGGMVGRQGAGGHEGVHDNGNAVSKVTELSKVTIADVKINSFYGTNVGMCQQNGDNTPWDYKALINSQYHQPTNTSLTLTNVTASGDVFIPVGSVTLTSADAGMVEVKGTLTAASSNAVTVAGDSKTNDAIDGDAAKLTNYIKVNKAVDANGNEFTLFEDETTVNLDAGTIVGAVSGTVTDGVANTTEAPNETNVAMADLPNINHMITRVEMNDLRKRMGDIRLLEGNTGVWARWDGGKLKGDNGLTNDFHKIQAGIDTTTGIDNLSLGAAFSYTNSDMEFAKADAESDTMSLAAYGVWTADNGMFADVIARLAFIDTEIQTDKVKGDLDNIAFSLSGEYGWRFDLCDKFFVEPQLELTYTYVNSDELTSAGAKFDFDSSDSLIGRAGMAAGWKLPNELGELYARASVVQEFMGDGKLTASMGNTVRRYETDGDDTWFEYGVGANIKVTNNAYVFADVERTEGAEIDEEWRGTVGFRFSF